MEWGTWVRGEYSGYSGWAYLLLIASCLDCTVSCNGADMRRGLPLALMLSAESLRGCKSIFFM